MKFKLKRNIILIIHTTNTLVAG